MNSPNIKILKMDITCCNVEAIVNPANSLMRMGGGVAGAIRRAAGRLVEEEAMRQAPVPVGCAIATSAGRLRTKFIIHAPTMEKPAMRTTKEKVYLATAAALKLAEALNIKSIAFPAMGAGVGGIPLKESAETILSAINQHLSSGTTCLEEIFLVGLSDDVTNAFSEAMQVLITAKK